MESTPKPGPGSAERPFPIVCIGASAGGLQPFERFLSVLPERFDFAVVFMQHLSPKHKDLLPELLRSRTKGLDIREASDGLDVLAGKVYLCPSASEVRIEKGTFRMVLRSRPHTHLPIDELLVSLSGDAAERTIAVILSGAGTDGARGVQAVKTRGGTVFVQDPASAEYPDMPLAAIDTGQTDGVLSPEDIAREIQKFQRSGIVAVPDDRFMTPVQYDSLFQIVNERTGGRFNHYKPNVVARRVRRRMYLHGVVTVNEYLKLLAHRDQEAAQLASDLLIGVTAFFRDRLAWKALHLDVTRKLVAEGSATPIRVWAAACATGEEAYSIAMMLQHELDAAGSKREIQVFATDVNDRALERAREGTYPASISADLPPDYLRTYFTSSESGLSVTVNKEIRQRVIFARQDLLTDPPFSRLDLIICRNLLIYLEPEAQERCISIFHYALKKGGYLFLGNAESPGRGSSLFEALAHKKCRVYRKAEARGSIRVPLSLPYVAERSRERQKSAPEHRQSLTHFIQAALLEEHAPAAVAINQNHEILYHNGPTNRYLRQPRGTPTQNLLELLPEKLKNRIRGALYRAGQEALPVTIRTSITVDERKKQVHVRISRLQENLFLITFSEKGSVPAEAESPLDTAAIEETAVYQLEHELAATRDDLQSHIEELKSVNEEMESSNEELQAANEELETSREELQSLNEELTTVNSQLQTKIEEQEGTNNDLSNFLTSTNIPTIFLDQNLRVKRFTPAMGRLIRLIPADVGRSIMDMSRENLGPELIADARSVLDTLTPLRREITINGAWYVRTTLPYRTGDNRIEGTVITYVDITERMRAEEHLRISEERMRLLVEGARDYALFMLDESGHVASWNTGAERIKGWTSQEILGRHFSCFYPQELVDRGQPQRELEIAAAVGEYHEEGQRLRKDGSRFWADVTITALRDVDGHLRGFAKLTRDITERKQAEEHIRLLASFPEINPNPILEVDAGGVVTFYNPATQTALEREGLDAREAAAFLPWDMVALLDGWDRQTDVMISREVSVGARVFDEAVHLVSQFNVARIYARDVTTRKQAEEALAESRRRLAVIVDSIADGFFAMDRDWRIIHVNDAALGHFGRTRDEMVGRLFQDVFPNARGTSFEIEYGRAMETGEPVHFESPSLVSDRTVEVHAYPGPDNLTVLFRDVTERKRADARVFRQNRVLEGINRIFEETLGTQTDEDLARTCLRVAEDLTGSKFGFIDEIGPDGFLHDIAISDPGWEACKMTDTAGHRKPSGSFKVHGIYGRVFEDGKGFFTNDPASHPDSIGLPSGHPPLTSFLGVPLTMEGRTIGLIAVGNRDTGYTGEELEALESLAPAMVEAFQRKRAEEGLRISEEHYRSLFENMLNGFAYCKMLFDENGPKDFTYLNVNAAFEALTGLKNVIGRNVSEVIPGIRRSDPELFEIYGRVALTGTPERFETYVEALGMWFSIAVYSPRREHFVAVFDVITERKRTEEALRKAHDELEIRVRERTVEVQQAYDKLKEETEERRQIESQLRQAQKVEALGTLSGGIAHDFNNILAAIIGFTELVAGHAAIGSRDARHLKRVMEASIRGRELVRQMLTFSRKTEQEKKPLRVSSIVRETVKLMRATTPSTINIKVRVLTESDVILADPTQVQQVLMNLCTNATHAMQAFGGNLDIDLDSYSVSLSNGDPNGIAPGRYVRLTVRDTGIGVPADIMEKIFDPFFTTKKPGEGSGLGLSVVHGIVKQHDGYITVISEPGRGSTFTVCFPRVSEALETDAAGDDEIPTGTERILFVDDEEALVEMGEDILAELGYDVTARRNGHEALALLKEDPSRFDLVITDQTMPEMTGIELAGEIRAMKADMPIIMCTGFSYLVDAESAKRAGIKAFAMKPLTKREIAKTIRRVLDE